MGLAVNKFISAMLNPTVFFITQIHQAIIAAVPSGVDRAFNVHLLNGLMVRSWWPPQYPVKNTLKFPEISWPKFGNVSKPGSSLSGLEFNLFSMALTSHEPF